MFNCDAEPNTRDDCFRAKCDTDYYNCKVAINEMLAAYIHR